jgi:hypothetical protein
MYLIGIKDNCCPAGNTGTLITQYKAEYKIRETAASFAKMHSHDEVYRLDHYPQRLCEMTGSDFVSYVRKNCKRYI